MNTTKPDTSWLKTFSIGFSIISFGITIAIIGYIVLTTKQTQPTNQQPTATLPTISPSTPTPFIFPTTDPSITANWKTYTSEEMGISIQYPDNWKVIDEHTWVTIYNGQKLELPPDTPADPYPVSLHILKRNGINAQKVCDEELCYDNLGNPVYKFENVKINNATGVKLVGSLQAIGSEVYYLSTNGKVVRLQYGTHEREGFALYKDVFENILSTFKFTHQ